MTSENSERLLTTKELLKWYNNLDAAYTNLLTDNQLLEANNQFLKTVNQLFKKKYSKLQKL